MSKSVMTLDWYFILQKKKKKIINFKKNLKCEDQIFQWDKNTNFFKLFIRLIFLKLFPPKSFLFQFGPSNMKLLHCSQKFSFILFIFQSMSLREKRDSHWNMMKGRKKVGWPDSVNKKTKFSVNVFLLTRKVLFKYLLASEFPIKVNHDCKEIFLWFIFILFIWFRVVLSWKISLLRFQKCLLSVF